MPLNKFLPLLFLFLSCSTSLESVCSEYGESGVSGIIEDGNPVEISGLAVSSLNPGLIWIHNDSGHAPIIYGIDRSGNLVRELILDGVEQSDWEDISLGKIEGERVILIADTGDNSLNRDSISIYSIPEPDLKGDYSYEKVLITQFSNYRFKYPEVPRDAEGAAFHPDGTLYLFTKEEGSSSVYSISNFERGVVNYLIYRGYIITDGAVTAVDINKSGTRMVTMSQSGIVEYTLETGNFSSLFDAEGRVVESVVDSGSEAVGYDPETGHIFHISETGGGSPPLMEIECR
jgi:hypothetical protein